MGGVASNFVQVVDNHAGFVGIEQWACPNAPAGSTVVVVNLSGVDNPIVDIFEISGLALSSVADQFDSGFSNGTSAWSSFATAATTQAEEIVIGNMGGYDALFAGPAPVMAGPAAFTNGAQQTVNSWLFGLAGYQVVSAIGSYVYNGTSNLASPDLVYAACVATYKAAATSAPANFVYAEMTGEAKDSSFQPVGSLIYANESTGLHTIFTWSANGPLAQTMQPGDTNVNQVGETRMIITADVPITSSTVYTQIFGFQMGVGTYEFDCVLKYIPTANNGKIGVDFIGGVTVATMGLECVEIIEGAPGVLGNVAGVTAFGVQFAGSAMTNGVGRTLHIFGTFIVTTAGIVGLDVINAVAAADTFTVKQLGSYLNLRW
ncbi:MAG TPA: hypothetical protein VKJ65_14045, partial [Phycisphaerae bacterium]|nr:hypothetical protein [Phycisphaerae bacterium]